MVAHEVKDMELNREIFDIDDEAPEDPSQLNEPETEIDSHVPSPAPPEVGVIVAKLNSNKEKVDVSEEGEIIQVLDCPIEESSGILSTKESEARKSEAAEAGATSSTNTTISVVKSGRDKSRRFDSVRGLLGIIHILRKHF